MRVRLSFISDRRLAASARWKLWIITWMSFRGIEQCKIYHFPGTTLHLARVVLFPFDHCELNEVGELPSQFNCQAFIAHHGLATSSALPQRILLVIRADLGMDMFVPNTASIV